LLNSSPKENVDLQQCGPKYTCKSTNSIVHCCFPSKAVSRRPPFPHSKKQRQQRRTRHGIRASCHRCSLPPCTILKTPWDPSSGASHTIVPKNPGCSPSAALGAAHAREASPPMIVFIVAGEKGEPSPARLHIGHVSEEHAREDVRVNTTSVGLDPTVKEATSLGLNQ
jgi:hypothetical protein